jgi:ACS family hexuronate transporter-like MFS transporter
LSDGPIEKQKPVPAKQILEHRAAWGFLVGKFLTDPVWWFYLSWIPGFLHDAYKLDIISLGAPLIVIYVMADVGSIGGGWLFSGMINLGWSINRSRKVAMLICAAMAVPVISVFYVKTLWPAVLLIGLAAAAHQGWSANLFTMASDAFPRRAVASVVGIGGLGGSIGGMLVAPAIGHWLDYSHKAYAPIFFIAGTMYLFALLIIHCIVPKLRLVHLGEDV